MATSIDDNEADEKSDKPRCQLINIRCTSTSCIKYLAIFWAKSSVKSMILGIYDRIFINYSMY